MQLGVHVVSYPPPGRPADIAGTLARIGAAADEAGLGQLSLMDHHLQLQWIGNDHDPMLEGYTTLGFLAAHTRRVELLLLVTGVTYRHPGLLAKAVTTLDVLSGGRAVLGIGAAWYEREHRALGVPFPPLKERFERLEEALRVIRQMWGPDDGPFAGQHYELAETICAPAPLHPIPVMIGGNGERQTLRLVAQYADACNLIVGGDDVVGVVRHKLGVLRDHCESAGTDYDRLRRTVFLPHVYDPARDADDLLARIDALAAVGVTEVHLSPMGPAALDPVGFVNALGEHVVPRLEAG
jgi:F420-dependent oxidoreductase-like protein